jgi:thioredoxin:protein disulfide reductase
MNRLLVCVLLLIAMVLPAAADDVPTPASSMVPTSRGGLSFLKDPAADQPADPEQAFVISVTAVAIDALAIRFDVADCCYLYRDKIKLELKGAPAGVRLGRYELPRGKTKTDEFLGKVAVYEKPVDMRVPVTALERGRGATLKVTYQGCASTPIAICYPPTTKEFPLPQFAAATPVATATTPTPAAPDKKFYVYLLLAFGTGLLLTFTPCVLPMVPILSSAIVGSSDKRLSKLEGGLLSYSYVLGTALTYTIAGVVAGATGQQLQAYFQNPWAIGAFTALLLVFAASLFGFFHLQLPAGLQSFLHHHGHRLHHRTRHAQGRAYLGVFVLGLLSALIIGACATPILLAVLGAAMDTRDPVLGGGMMFMLAHGQGVFLVALGVGASFLLPKAGPWMDTIKHVFGALLVAVAIYLLGAIPEVPVLLLWGVYFIVAAVFLGATRRLPDDAGGWRLLWKGLGIVLLIWGALALVGGFIGNRDVFRPLPLSVLSGKTDGRGPAANTERVRTVAELDRHLLDARAAGKPVLVDYYADWCLDCVRMEGTTFRDPRVVRELERFTVVQADITDALSNEGRALKRRFNIYAPPALVFVDRDGRDRRVYGFRSAEELLTLLREL